MVVLGLLMGMVMNKPNFKMIGGKWVKFIRFNQAGNPFGAALGAPPKPPKGPEPRILKNIVG